MRSVLYNFPGIENDNAVQVRNCREAMRNDDQYAYVAAWQFKGEDQPEELHKEELKFENVKLTQRSYK